MPQATQPLFKRLALVFDFDETLAEDSFAALLRHVGLEPDSFKKERVQPLIDEGWETILARSYALIQASKNGGTPITRDVLAEVGKNIRLFDGVQEMFGRVREAARAIVDDIEVGFYLLTSGFVDIPRASTIAGEFKTLWGDEFYFEDNEIAYMKKIVPHAEKPLYLRLLSQGSDEEKGNPTRAYREVSENERYIPLSQIIYVGDGASDIPAFDLMNETGGIALGIVLDDEADSWKNKDEMQPGRRVQNLAPADYSEDSELMVSLVLATETICKQIALRALSKGE